MRGFWFLMGGRVRTLSRAAREGSPIGRTADWDAKGAGCEWIGSAYAVAGFIRQYERYEGSPRWIPV